MAHDLGILAQLCSTLARGACRDKGLTTGVHYVASLQRGRGGHAAMAYAFRRSVNGPWSHAGHESKRRIAERSFQRIQAHPGTSIHARLSGDTFTHFLDGLLRTRQASTARGLSEDAPLAQDSTSG